MGIKNLKTIIDRFAKNSVFKKHLSDYENKKIVIDTSIFLYKFMYNYDSCYLAFIQQITKLRKYNIIPIYIFDGKPPKEKNETLKQRREKKQQYKNRKNELEIVMEEKVKDIENLMNEREQKKNKRKDIENNEENDEIVDDQENEQELLQIEENLEKMQNEMDDLQNEHTKVKKRIINITSEMVNNLQELFRSLGVTYYIADGEADVLCTELMKRNIVDACISEDSDILANGGKCLIKKFHLMNDFIMEYTLENILNAMDMSYEQFLDLCILCGSDYNTKIPGLGVISAYKNLKEHGNIEGIIATNRYNIPENFEYQRVRDLYLRNSMEINEADYHDIHIMKKSRKDLWNEVLQKNNIQLDFGIEKLVEKYFFTNLSNQKKKKQNHQNANVSAASANKISNYFNVISPPANEDQMCANNSINPFENN